MEQNNEVQVVIGGKVLTMSGSEDEMQIQRVAACVNRMIKKLEGTEVYHSLPADIKPLLIELNIAEELIRVQEREKELENDLQLRDNELAELKQTLADTQLALERLEGKSKR